ncbi:flagellar biogenesis protein [Hafnia alvei]|uniref:flagellar basal body-associated FliL family protein n=1 Tax=Hafnia alvei TaxID=569 RepID=UPI00058262FA|nr:flagellar basal body-associated FliL family protein [Hafnia alvei]KID06621.1 flagellar biogenesis protein [Hafnia alvei]
MTVKTFSLGLVIALVAAVLAAVLAIMGNHILAQPENGVGDKISKMFSADGEATVEFVEIKNVVITLKSDNKKERYLLLELALATSDGKETARTEAMVPAIRGATVSLLSDMEYSHIRGMNVVELREQLMAAYVKKFKALNTGVPFHDVIISKMVFQ